MKKMDVYIDTQMMIKKESNYILDIIRLMFIIIICLMHFEYAFFGREHIFFEGSYLGVEWFFILNGFFLHKSINECRYKSSIEYLNYIFMKLFPYNFSVILLLILCKIYWIYADLGRIINIDLCLKIAEFILYIPYEMIFLQMYLPSNLLNFPIWYISIMMLSGVIYCLVLLFNKSDNVILLISITCIVLLMFISNLYGNIDVHINNNDFLKICPGLLRGIADMGIGIVMFRLKDSIKIPSKYLSICKLSLLLAIALSLKYFPHSKLDFVVIMYMACFISIEWVYPIKIKSKKITQIVKTFRELSIEIYFIHHFVIQILLHKWNIIPKFIKDDMNVAFVFFIGLLFISANILNCEVRMLKYIYKSNKCNS